MSLERIHLRKLLQLLYLRNRPRRAAILKEIRSDERRAEGLSSSGGDFYAPFWADVRSYVARGADLTSATDQRIADNERRRRLYAVLTTGFLDWWNDGRRWTNEAYEYIEINIRARYIFGEINCTVKIENVLSVRLESGSHRLIYPYFCEAPPITDESGRVGLHLLHAALPDHALEDLRILDVPRGALFAQRDHNQEGNERDTFLAEFAQLHREWQAIEAEIS